MPSSPAPVSFRGAPSRSLWPVLLQSTDQFTQGFIKRWLNIVSTLKRLQHLTNRFHS